MNISASILRCGQVYIPKLWPQKTAANFWYTHTRMYYSPDAGGKTGKGSKEEEPRGPGVSLGRAGSASEEAFFLAIEQRKLKNLKKGKDIPNPKLEKK